MSNWLDPKMGGDAPRLMALAESAPDWQPTAETKTDTPDEGWPSSSKRIVERYAESEYGIYSIGLEDDGKTKKFTQIANFAARIVGDELHDDGAETYRRFEIESYQNGQRRECKVSASEFARMDWVIKEIGAKAIVSPGHGVRDKVRAAIQTMSPPTQERIVYAHTGWRQIDGQQVYLHAGGAIGAAGLVPGIETDLSEQGLAAAMLPPPPQGEWLKAAIRSSIALLDIGPFRIMAPLYSSIWRATFGSVNFSASEVGETGKFKTELAALVQQHWGAGFVSTNLPAAWSSTGNSLEVQAHAAKDMIFVIDDFAPRGSQAEINQMHTEAARFYRAQGNMAGRRRLRPDGSPRPDKPPRCLALSTGEDLPRGKSIRARTFIIEVRAGDITSEKLTKAQEAGERGDYALAMSGWLRHLAATPAARNAFQEERRRLRAEIKSEHARTPWMAADLLAALKVFFAFAVAVEAITEAAAAVRFEQCRAAIIQGASEQSEHMRSQDDTARFIQLIGAALVTGRAHLANTSDGTSAPALSPDWGWHKENFYANGMQSTQMKPGGDLIGWTGEEDAGAFVWLEPTAAYGIAQKLAALEGNALAVGKETLWKRLSDARKIARHNPGRNLHRKTIGGRGALHLLCLHAASLKPPTPKVAEKEEEVAFQEEAP